MNGREPAPDAGTEPLPLDVVMMRRALALAAHAASLGEVPVGAVVYASPVEGNTAAIQPEDVPVIAGGYNRREIDQDPAAHAELIAIREAARVLGSWRLNECSLAVTLEPCPMCAGLIVNARVGRVIYAAKDPKAGAVDSLFTLLADARLNHRPRVIGGVLADEAGEMLRDFFRRLRASGG
jgi:tRNA(Arg) A34 adenosine deaminase TadA